MQSLYRYCQQNSLIWVILVAFSNSLTALGLLIQSIITVQSNNWPITLV
jgi:hypothetical protein